MTEILNKDIKILIAIPTYKFYSLFWESLSRFCLELNGHYKYDIYTVCYKTLVDAQNDISEYFLKRDYTHLLMLEDDHHGHTKAMLDALVRPNVDVCGINYYSRWFPYNSCLMEEVYPDRPNQKYCPVDCKSGYKECDLIGFGMTLISRRVLELLPKPTFIRNRPEKEHSGYATDEAFCVKLKSHGIKLLGCWDYTLAHRDINKDNVIAIRNSAILKSNEIIRDKYYSGEKNYHDITEEMLRDVSNKPSIHELDNKYADKICYIVGRGPSVINLTEEYFPTDGPIIAINDTFERVELLNIPNDIYSLQKDCGFGRPQRSTLLVHAQEESSLYLPDYHPRYEFDANQFGLPRSQCFSATVALRFAQVFGCKIIKMLCFDSITIKDFRTQEGWETNTILSNRNAYHYQEIIQQAQIYRSRLDVEYITPGLKEGKVINKSALYDIGVFS